MTKDEKLKKALEALKTIAENQNPMSTLRSTQEYAAEVLKELTAPRMETVKGWINIYNNGASVSHFIHKTREEADSQKADNRTDCIEITYQRPVEEKKDVWEGVLTTDERGKPYVLFKDTPTSNYNGKNVEVRLKEAE